MSDEPEITTQKTTGYFAVSREVLEAAWNFTEQMNRLIAEAADPNRPKPPPPPNPGPNQRHVALLEAAKDQPVLVEILQLHEPEPFTVYQDGSVPWWQCRGDEFGGYDGELPDWPCETVGIIARHLGVGLSPVKTED